MRPLQHVCRTHRRALTASASISSAAQESARRRAAAHQAERAAHDGPAQRLRLPDRHRGSHWTPPVATGDDAIHTARPTDAPPSRRRKVLALALSERRRCTEALDEKSEDTLPLALPKHARECPAGHLRGLVPTRAVAGLCNITARPARTLSNGFDRPPTHCDAARSCLA